MKYRVEVKEVWITNIENIEAESKEEALDKANDLLEEGDIFDSEYSHTLDLEDWNVYDEKGDLI